MLAFQFVARQQVVELLLRWLPVNQAEVFTVVLQVTPHTVFPIWISHPQPGVVAVIRSKALRDLSVAIEALESWRAGPELMATRTLRGSSE